MPRLTARLTLSLVLLILAGCGTLEPRRPRVPPTTVPETRLAQLIGLLQAEWSRWGQRIALLTPGMDFCLVLDDGRCAEVDDGCGQEQQPALCPVVNDYWRVLPADRSAVHTCLPQAVCEAVWPSLQEGMAKPRTPPWSAAFVSAMMRRAGFSDTEFAFDSSHVNYLIAARDHTASAYEVVPTPAPAAPGDLICAVRGAADIRPHELHRLQGGQHGATPMHCDIVVAVDPAGRTLEAIGGNVQQTVAKTIVTLDANGQVSHDTHPQRRWVAVMRARREQPPAAPQASNR